MIVHTTSVCQIEVICLEGASINSTREGTGKTRGEFFCPLISINHLQFSECCFLKKWNVFTIGLADFDTLEPHKVSTNEKHHSHFFTRLRSGM